MDMENKAAWLETKHSVLKVGSAPTPKAGLKQVVVKTAAVAINPVNWKIQQEDLFGLNYPNILGEDFSGEIVEVGEGVTELHVGNRVLGYTGSVLAEHDDAKKAFQQFILVSEDLVTPIPPELSYENATVIPLGLATAACALYEKGFLGLAWPSINPVPQQHKVVIVWGGSSSVGVNTIQLAKLSGYQVITTCSPHNFELCKSLGADHVFDYKSSTVVEDILASLIDKQFAGGFDCVSDEGVAAAFLQVVKKLESGNKYIIKALGYNDEPMEEIPTKWVFSQLITESQVGRKIFAEFLPEALAAGKFVPAPNPLIVEQKGLEGIQSAMDKLREGVSGKKSWLVSRNSLITSMV